jgi:hypothetical protein
MLRRFASAVVFLALSSLATSALADDGKRPKQDYGHPPEGTDAGDVIAWPFRVILFPAWLVSEYLLRRPIGWLVVQTEKNNVIATVQDFFTFGSHDQVTVYPSALFDFGLLPSVGFNLAWHDFLTKDNTFRFHFGTWGPQWLMIKGTNTYDFSKKEHLTLNASFIRRQDTPFFGIGPDTHEGAETRFGAQTFDFDGAYKRDLWRSSAIETTAGVRGNDFYHGSCCGDPSLDFAILDNRLPLPPGYKRSYYGGYQRMSLAIDSRKPRPASGTGFRVEAHEETFFDLSRHAEDEPRSWVKYGGSVGGALDFTGHQRVLGVTLVTEFADPIQGQVPFTDLVMLGGDDLFPGYVRNRLIDRSAAVAHIQYTWPVWMYLDGVINASVGNVWGEHLDNFKFQDSRINAGIGVRSNGDRASGFELLLGAGTDPVSEGFNVSSFRFLVGSHHGL